MNILRLGEPWSHVNLTHTIRIYVSQGHIPMCKCVAKLYIVLPSLLGLALIDWAYILAGSGSPVLNVSTIL